jgi:di/tricarboxylate transporter
VALLLAALAVVLAGAIRVEEMYDLLDWRLLVLIGGMTSFGLAMEKAGAARWLAQVIAGWTEPFGVHFVLGTFLVLTMLLTQPMSNAAAALVVLPVAVSTALEIGVEPRTFAILVTLAASLSFIAPLEPACLLVYGPGKYRFRDFVIAGSPLSLLVLVILLVLAPGSGRCRADLGPPDRRPGTERVGPRPLEGGRRSGWGVSHWPHSCACEPDRRS